MKLPIASSSVPMALRLAGLPKPTWRSRIRRNVSLADSAAVASSTMAIERGLPPVPAQVMHSRILRRLTSCPSSRSVTANLLEATRLPRARVGIEEIYSRFFRIPLFRISRNDALTLSFQCLLQVAGPPDPSRFGDAHRDVAPGKRTKIIGSRPTGRNLMPAE